MSQDHGGGRDGEGREERDARVERDEQGLDALEDDVIATALGVPGASLPSRPASDTPDEADMMLTEYREVLAHLPFEEVAPPGDAEERVLAAARTARVPAARSLPTAGAGAGSGAGTNGSRAMRRSRDVGRVAVLVAAAAAAIVGVVSMQRDGPALDRRDVTYTGCATPADVDALLATRDARTLPVTLDGARVGSAVLTPAGDGAVYDLDVPGLADGETFTLWLTDGTSDVAIGDVDACGAAFEVDGDVRGVYLTTG